MKNLFFIALVILILSSLVVAGCSAPAPTTPPDSNAQTPPAQAIDLLFATFTTETGFLSHGIKAFGADLEQKTNGRIKVEYSWAQALGKPQEYYDLTLRGVAPVGNFLPTQVPGVFQILEISGLPFIYPKSEIATNAYFELYKKGYLDKKLDEGLKTLFICVDAGNLFFTANKKVNTIADLKGLKIKAVGGLQNKVVESLGAVPVVITGTDIYPALEKGVVDGQIVGWAPLPAFKWCEVQKYAIEKQFTTTVFVLSMNKDVYNKLPADIQKIIDEMAADNNYGLIAAKGIDSLNTSAQKCFADHGGEILKLDSGSIEEMGKKFTPIFDEWIAEKEAKGLPARKTAQELYNSLITYGVDNPAFGYTP